MAMLLKVLVTSALVSSLTVSLAAAEDAAERGWSGALFFTTGYTQSEKGGLGTALRNGRYGDFADGNVYLGGGGYFMFRNNVFLGGSGGGIIPAAEGVIKWDAGAVGVGPGVYIARISAGEISTTVKFVVAK